jgi:hypothetical protein
VTVRRATLRLAGTVAVLASAYQVVTGVSGVREVRRNGTRSDDVGGLSPSIDSELRFYAVWYGLAGVLMHKAATDDALDRSLGSLLSAGWGAAALARLASARAVGAPDPLFVALGGVEALLAAILAKRREVR